MSLSVKLMDEIKTAMRAKDTIALEALRAIKSEILLAQTASGNKEEISEADEIKLLQKLVKTRKDSAKIFTNKRLDIHTANGSVLHGMGMVSNDSFTKYRILKPVGEITVNETPE